MQITTITQEEAREMAEAIAVMLDAAPSYHEVLPATVPYVPQESPDLMVQEVY